MLDLGPIPPILRPLSCSGPQPHWKCQLPTPVHLYSHPHDYSPGQASEALWCKWRPQLCSKPKSLLWGLLGTAPALRALTLSQRLLCPQIPGLALPSEECCGPRTSWDHKKWCTVARRDPSGCPLQGAWPGVTMPSFLGKGCRGPGPGGWGLEGPQHSRPQARLKVLCFLFHTLIPDFAEHQLSLWVIKKKEERNGVAHEAECLAILWFTWEFLFWNTSPVRCFGNGIFL